MHVRRIDAQPGGGVVQGLHGGDRRLVVDSFATLVVDGAARHLGDDRVDARFVVGTDHQLVVLEAVADPIGDECFDEGAASVVLPLVEAVPHLVFDLPFGQLGQTRLDQTRRGSCGSGHPCPPRSHSFGSTRSHSSVPP